MHGAIALAWMGTWMVGCAPEYGFQSVGPEAAGDLISVGTSVAFPEVAEPEPPRVRDVELGGAERSTVADYLFVVDASSSMADVLNRVLDGFDAIGDVNPFPSDARIGVMSTLPAHPLRTTAIHPRARQRWWLQFLPGFQSVVDEEAIAVFREVAPAHVAERYPIDGCGGWFAPKESNAKGVPCIVANTQLALYPVLVEAGLLALHQRLERGDPLFRSGASANVIFLSDTHDPGLSPSEDGYAELMAARPTFEQLRVLAMSRQPLASFRVHAIAPAERCADEDWTAGGPSYFEAARASGGEMIDVCTAKPEDYVGFIERMASAGALRQSPVIALQPDEQVLDVLVDGEPAEYAISPDGRAVSLAAPLPADKARVRLVLR